MRLTRSRFLAAGALAAVCLLGGGKALAQGTAGDVRVDLDLKDADMTVATQMLAKQSGVQFIIEPSNEPFLKVTLSLKQRTLEEAVKYVCMAAGATARLKEDGVWIISHTKPEAPVKTTNDNNTPPPVKKPKVVKKIRLMKADPRDVFNQIVFGTISDEYSGARRMKEFQRLMQIGSPAITNTSRVFLQQVNPVSVQNLSSGQTNGESGNEVALPGGEAAEQIGGRGGGMGGGMGGGFGGNNGGFGGNNGGFGGNNGGFGGNNGGFGGNNGGFGGNRGGGGGFGGNGGSSLLGQDSSIDYLTYDPTDNSFIVRGNDDDIKDLQNWISMFDQAPAQVLVKVEFVTTSSSLDKDIGMDWQYSRGMMTFGNTPGFFAVSGDPFFLNFASGDVTMRLRANLLQGDGKVVNAPILRTLNNQPAYVNESTSTTIFLNQVVSTGTQILTIPNPQQLTINTGLQVTPRINGDGTITMFLNPSISDFGQIRTGPDGTQIPDQLSQTIAVVARVKNGETIVLGGMTRKSDQGTLLKYPILGDLPIIGQFFRRTTVKKDHSELLIFVTPTIVSDEDNGGLAP